MFEGLVAKILNKYLSEYIDSVDYNNLKIGLNLFTISGSFELKNVNIKSSALYQFDLPIEVKYGKIGKLKICIPIKNLNQEAARIEVEDVFVLLVPFEKKIFDSKKVEELIQAHKKKQLYEMEKLDSIKQYNQEKRYADQIQDTILNNIKIEIKNVHIRYEDKYSVEIQSDDKKTKINIPISLGIYLKSFITQTVDINQQPYFAKSDENTIYKNSVLEGLNLYWNSHHLNPGTLIIQQEEFKSNKDKDYCLNLLKNSIDTGKLFNFPFDKILKKNLDFKASLKLRRHSQDYEGPKITFKSSINSIDFFFRPHQYKSLIKLINCYSMLNENKKHIKYRPNEPLTSATSFKKYFKTQDDAKKDSKRIAKLWWQYLMTGICEKKWRSYKKERISMHWKNYKEYIERYYKKLNKEIKNEKINEQENKYLEQLESKLNLESILDARNHVKEKLKKEFPNLYNLDNENSIEIISEDRQKSYVDMRFKLNFPSIKLKLINETKEILSIEFIEIFTQFETRPVANSFYLKIDTKDIEVKGIHYDKLNENTFYEMVTIVSSRNTSNNNGKFIQFSYESNPLSIENVEFSIKTCVTSLEIFYEKSSITEIIRFFSGDTNSESYNEYTNLGHKLNVWSTAGVLYALDNHKQFYVEASLSSPYFIIPVTGTRKKRGNTVIFFLGETTIQSDLQQKRNNYSTSNLKDLEQNFYDKLKLQVNDIQVMLITSDIDLKDYLSNLSSYGFKYHLLYPVTTENILYFSINPKFKRLPKIKIDAKCPSVKVNLSDKKIIELVDFLQKIESPEIISRTNSNQNQNNFSKQSLTFGEQMSTHPIKIAEKFNETSLDNIVEFDDEWEGPFRIPTDINSKQSANYAHVWFIFNMNDFNIDLKVVDDHSAVNPIENEYLNLVFNNIKLNFAITKYGFHLKSSLGNLKLTDKKHHFNNGCSTEILSSLSNNDLIELKMRRVDSVAPNFVTLYHSTLLSISLKFRSIQLVAHRTGIIYLLQYGKKIAENINFFNYTREDEQTSLKNESEGLIRKLNFEDNICDLNVIANMKELKWKMYDSDINFGDMEIKNLQVIYKLTGIITDLKVRLETIFVNYESNSILFEPYKKIVSCTAGEQNRENFFDFKLVFYDTSKIPLEDKSKRFDDKIFLSVGKIKVIFLAKFINELISFIEPIVTSIEPVSDLAVQISDITGQAVNMAVNIYQETQTEESLKKILLNIEVSSPLVIVPRNSNSKSAFFVELGNLKITNKFLEEQKNQAKKSIIDEIEFILSDVKIKRIKYIDSEQYLFNEIEKIINPINMNAFVRRIVSTQDWSNESRLKISIKITNLDSCISVKTVQLLFLILDENLNEGIQDSNLQVLPNDEKITTGQIDTNSSKNDLNKNDQQVEKEIEICVELCEIKLKIVDIIEVKKNNINTKEIVGFSLLFISSIEFTFSKYDTIKWDAIFKMKALSLEDLRTESNLAVKEMFVPLDSNEYFIDLTYTNSTETESFLSFNINHLRINLCLPYILKLYQMAMEAIMPPNKELQQNNNKTPKKNTNKTDNPVNSTTVQTGNNKIFRTKADINLPEIILFAEPENPNTMILFMSVLLELDFNSNNDGLNLEIRMNQLSMRLGEFKNIGRKGIPFLTPCNAVLNMIQKQGEKLAYYFAEIPSLYFNMTPTLYKVVIGVINTLNKTGTEKREIEQQKITLNIEASEPFKKQKLEKKHICYQNDLDLEEDDNNNSERNNENEEETDKKLTELFEALDLRIEKAFITFCEETGVDLQPLAVVRIDLNGRISNWTKYLHCKANLSLEASYYNDILSNWEPLIENIMEEEDKYRPWKLNLWFAIHPSRILEPPCSNLNQTTELNIDFPVNDLDYSSLHRIYRDKLKLPLNDWREINKYNNLKKQSTQTSVKNEYQKNQTVTASYIIIESDDILNLNVTPSAYKVIIYLAKIAAGTDKDKILENKSKSQIKFLNFLNEKATLYVSNDTMLREEDAKDFTIINYSGTNESQILKQNKKRNLKNEFRDLSERISKIAEASQRPQIDTVYDEKYKFFIKINGFNKCELSLKTDGCYLIGLTEEVTNEIESIKYNLMYKIRTNYGRTKVLFSSPLQIENNSQIKLYVLIEMTDEIKANKSKYNILKTFSVSFDMFDSSHNKTNENKQNREFGVIFELKPSKVYYVPLYFAYKCKLYTSPQNLMYAPSLIFDIRGYNFRKEEPSYVLCKRINKTTSESENQFDMNDFLLMKILSVNVSSHRNIMITMHANYKVVLFSPIKFYNCLPFDTRVQIYGHEENEIRSVECTTELKSGENFHINILIDRLEKFNLHLNDYLNGSWDYDINWLKLINSKCDNHRLEFQMIPDEGTIKSATELNVYLNYKKPNEYVLYSPYWLINNSGLPLQIKSVDDDRVYELNDERIVLFDFKHIKKKNNVKMKLKNSLKWSSKFSLDTVGTTGIIDCKDNDSKIYTFLIRSTLSNSSRTKLISFAPFLMIVNQLQETVEITECLNNNTNYADWLVVAENSPTAYWLNYHDFPLSGPPCFVLKLNNMISKPFPLQNPGRYVLCFNKNSPTQRICTVLISGGSTSPVSIIIREYFYGDSVAKLINNCDKFSIKIQYESEDEDSNIVLLPSEFTYFVWPNPKDFKREFLWTIENSNDFKLLDLTTSSQSKFTFKLFNLEDMMCVSSEESLNISNTDTKNLININSKCNKNKTEFNIEISCVSYMDGTQRIILFTTDHSFADLERKKEAASLEIFTSLKGLQISMINNINLEIATVSIRNNKPSWLLEGPNGNVKLFTDEYCVWLEQNYLEYIHQNRSKISFRSFNFDFDNMELEGPFIGKLNRISPPGLFVKYRTSASMMNICCSIQKLQIDNQLPDAYFPICFYKAPDLLSNLNPGPLITIDFFSEQQEQTQIYRYFRFNLSEFFLKVDKGFLYSLWDWYEATTTTSNIVDKIFDTRSLYEIDESEKILVIIDEEEKIVESLKLDKILIKEIMEYATNMGNVKQSSLIRFDDCRISSILCNLSFSVNGTAHTDDKEMKSRSDSILDFFLESLGSAITEFKDVKFFFSEFDIKNQTRTWDDLYQDFFNHFKLQGLHQTYALILGLDMLGNPFGLVTSVSHNLTDLFYDPLLGYFKNVKDDSKNVEDIELKIGSKLKETINKSISNLAGSGSLITGSFGRVLATCSFDKEYKKRRQYILSKSSTWKLSDTFKIAAKGIALGTLEGLTGVFEKPLEEKSLSGFGKGIAGFFVKPFGSLFDGISLTLDGLKRFANSSSESIVSVRLPRHLISNVAILPYSEYLAKGYEILRDLQYDNIAEEDEAYWSHLFYETKKSNELIFITNVKILKLKRTRFDIRTKWKQIEQPISIFKITRIEIQKSKTIQLPNNKSKFKTKSNVIVGKNKEIEYDLIIHIDKKNSTSNDKIKEEPKLLTSNLCTVKWLCEKINSIVKYCNETRKIKI